jgi:hypothetical protein
LLVNAKARRTQVQKSLHEFAAFAEGQSGEIAVITNQQVKNEVVDAGCFAAEILEQIEIRSA